MISIVNEYGTPSNAFGNSVVTKYGASLTSRTGGVALLVTLSLVPSPSVYDAVTVIVDPTSARVNLYVVPTAPLISVSLRFH